VEFERVFSSKPRMKILRLIWQMGSLNVSDVARRVKLNYTSTLKHLELLEAEGLLERRTYGRVQMFRFKDGSVKAKAVQTLIEVWQQNSIETKR
jgi:predicted ArsR family transcriptional regulator